MARPDNDIQHIRLPRSDDLTVVSQAMEKRFNELVDRLNERRFSGVLNMEDNRIRNVGRCVEMHDAVNRECLERRIIASERKVFNDPRIPKDGAPGDDGSVTVTGGQLIDFNLGDAVFPHDLGNANQHASLQNRVASSVNSIVVDQGQLPIYREAIYRSAGNSTATGPEDDLAHQGDSLLWSGILPPDFTLANDPTFHVYWKESTATDTDQGDGSGDKVRWAVALQSLKSGSIEAFDFPVTGSPKYVNQNLSADEDVNGEGVLIRTTISFSNHDDPAALDWFIVYLKRVAPGSGDPFDAPVNLVGFALEYGES